MVIEKITPPHQTNMHIYKCFLVNKFSEEYLNNPEYG
jgi:hypothetical protein